MFKTYRKTKKSCIDAIDIVENYVNGSDWRVKENSNSSYSLNGLSNHIATTVQSNYWLKKVYPKKIADAHQSGDIHIHDLGYISTYCVGWDLRDFLLKGHTGVYGKVACKPAKHLHSALDHIKNLLFLLRQEAAGAQAISSFDTYMAPFIRYDKLNYDQVKQLLQYFIFNMNVPLDKGFQAPFSNVTMDITPSGLLGEENVIIGGEVQKEKYKDFQEEMNMFNKAFAEVMMEGDMSGRVFTWPVPTYNLTKDLKWDDPMMDPIWEMTAKYGIPYFSNFINSDMNPDDVRSMCCRLRIDNRELRRKGGGLFGADPLTGSIGIVTINLPRIGYVAKTKKEFFKQLKSLMDLAKESLVIKRDAIEYTTEQGLYPYSKFYLSGIKERFGKYWSNHFNTIGINGMNEACLNFLKKDLLTKEGHEFALEVLDYMRDVMRQYQEETGVLFNLEATPAESTAYRFAKADKKKYPEIIVANEEAVEHCDAAPFYSNSSQLAVDSTDDVFEALENQDDLQCKYTGGTVFHVFVGEKIPSMCATKKLVKKIAQNYKLPYFSITPTFSICPEHGYMKGEHDYCESCKVKCEVYSRVVGYISPINCWNKGKKAEWSKRKSYKI
jgi:ribonucleoside-triphosphate reductase (formate)